MLSHAWVMFLVVGLMVGALKSRRGAFGRGPDSLESVLARDLVGLDLCGCGAHRSGGGGRGLSGLFHGFRRDDLVPTYISYTRRTIL